jgi:histidine triad (HIT) family protein
MNCIFCEIANKKIPSKVIYEDDVVISYLDINPDSNGHTLIIPKKHYTDLVDIDDATLSHIMSVARNLKKLLEDKLNIDGLTLIQNNGDVQEVKHYHLHLKPYYNGKQDILPIDDIYNKIKMS